MTTETTLVRSPQANSSFTSSDDFGFEETGVDIVPSQSIPSSATDTQFYRRIRFPRSSDFGWQFPSDDGQSSEDVPEFEGVIVAVSYPQDFYPGQFDPSNTVGPLCSSRDGLIGSVDFERLDDAHVYGLKARNDCGTCPLNQIGANPKCGSSATAWVLLKGESEPVAVRIPKGSLRNWRAYRKSLGGHDGVWQFVTNFSIGKSDDGNYKVAEFDTVDVALDSETLEGLREARDELIRELEPQGVLADVQYNSEVSTRRAASW